MKKALLFVILVAIWAVLLFPKTLLWDYFVIKMQERDIQLSAKETDIKLWLVYNRININDLEIQKIFKIDSLNIEQTALDPFYVYIDGSSQYGDFSSKIDLLDKKGYILFEKSDLKNAIFKSYFKKTKEGMKYEFEY